MNLRLNDCHREVKSLWWGMESHDNTRQMTLDEAREITGKMIKWKMKSMGAPAQGMTPDLSGYSLETMLTANRQVRESNASTSTGKVHMVCADRLVAAIYTVLHYAADPQSECTPIVAANGKALICIALDEGEVQ